jgi:hypothetical protein
VSWGSPSTHKIQQNINLEEEDGNNEAEMMELQDEDSDDNCRKTRIIILLL